MAYGVKYRITYCNKQNVNAQLDIEVEGYSGAIQNVIGTSETFVLRYELGERDNNIFSSFADIQLFENPITIDDLKTVSETDIRVKHYVNNALTWTGFVLPDFFEIDIATNAVISMSATDRLSVLKEKTNKTGLGYYSPIEMIADCLIHTKQNAEIHVSVNFTTQRASNILIDLRLSRQRLFDDKGRSVSAYDTLNSILTLFNAYLVFQNNTFFIVNKHTFENKGSATFHKFNYLAVFISSYTFTFDLNNFNEISIGGRRKIEASNFEVSYYHELGGQPIAPENYNFEIFESGNFANWTAFNSFRVAKNDVEVLSYTGSSPNFGTRKIANQLHVKEFVDINPKNIFTLPNYRSDFTDLNGYGAKINVNADFNITAKNGTHFLVGIVLKDSLGVYWGQNKDGNWNQRGSDYEGENENVRPISIIVQNESAGADDVISVNAKIGSTLDLNYFNEFYRIFSIDFESFDGFEIALVIFGSRYAGISPNSFVSMAKIEITSGSEQAKGTIFKISQNAEFSKKAETKTLIFADYLQSGINGNLYPYRFDDTSVIKFSNLSQTSKFTYEGETDYLAMLSLRQRSRMFAKARDILSIEIEANAFNPLTIFRCNGRKYVPISAEFNYFKSRLNVTLEEVVYYDALKTDFIYSYFGSDSDTGIKGIGGISSSVGGGTGGGGSSPQYWQLDEEGNLFTEYNAYSTKELSAYGLGSGGGGGGGSLVDWGTEANSYVPLIVEGVSKVVALQGHTHTKAEVGLSNVLNVASYSRAETDTLLAGKFNNPTGTTSQYIRGDGSLATYVNTTYSLMSLAELNTGTASNSRVVNSKNLNDWLSGKGYALSNHTHTFASLTSKPTTLSGYGITDAVTLNTTQTISGEKTFSGTVTAPTFSGALSGNASTATTATNLSRSISAGNGLTGGGTLTANRTITLGTPSTLTASTTNEVTTNSHTHSITTTTTGAPNTIVQTDSKGKIEVNTLHVSGLYATTEIEVDDLIQSDRVHTNTLYVASEIEVDDLIQSHRVHANTLKANDLIQSNGVIEALQEMQSPVYKLGNGWDIRASGTEIQFFYNGVKKGGFSTDGFYSTGEITAFN